ncbi:MAG TPA: isoamylase early set domain-containing protein [Spirochaetales bacterium]|nr:isoamylase early set domain-containing protein [Spirochaetales bacterium]HPM72600.1 isoamylase early set domain-containing protein [Spirochaetales bacterium]
MMLKKRYAKDGSLCTVTFIIQAEQADGAMTAHLSGDFNNWSRSANPMKRMPEGGFELGIKLEAGKEYHFRYLLDGERWDNDWHADKYVQSPFRDSDNSVVIV